MKPLEFREDNCLVLPDNIDDYNNSNFLIEEVKEKLENNIHINIFYKERISDPNISALLMIVDDRGKIDSGKKRKAILNKDFKYIGITSKYIDDVGTGEGLYVTNGKVIPITWKKSGKYTFAYKEEIFFQESIRGGACTDYGVTHFYTKDGEELRLNPGKTYITLFPDSSKENVSYE